MYQTSYQSQPYCDIYTLHGNLTCFHDIFPPIPAWFLLPLSPHFLIPTIRTASAATVGEPDAAEFGGMTLWHVGVGIGVFLSNRLASTRPP